MSTVAIAEYSPLDPRMVRNPEVTAKGEPCAHVLAQCTHDALVQHRNAVQPDLRRLLT